MCVCVCVCVCGGCLDDSRGYDVPALVNIQLDSSLLAAFFSHSGLGMDKKCPYLGCLWGVCKVSVWCLDGLEVIWDTSMGDKIVLLSEKVQSLSYISHTAFSPSAQFWQKSGKNDVFSDPCYGGSNVIFDQNRNIPQVLYIKLHLKMPGNINFF